MLTNYTNFSYVLCIDCCELHRLAHKLHFEDKLPVLAKDANTKDDDWFEISDPRNAINKRRREASKEQTGKISRKI